MRENICAYFDDNGQKMGLSDREISNIKSWYTIIVCCLFALTILQIIRIQANIHYRETSYKIEREFNALLDEDELAYTTQHETRKSKIRDKYDQMRSSFQEKYIKNLDESSTGSLNSV